MRYVFCRGPRADAPAEGMHAFKFDPALFEALDALFAGGAAAHAPVAGGAA